ncbi:MAG: large-conductance mechanosensitive channel protein MscL [Phycisphaerales bacterium]|nr:large-conductance mechanosensitive channel protein MscL [Phycisphaerales bacterium]
MGMIKEFKEFAMRGNVIDMAVGIVIGVAFGKIVSALVEKIFMPIVGALTTGVDFSKMGVEIRPGVAATDAVPARAPVILGYGAVIQSLIDFVIVAFCLFLVIKAMNRLMPKPPPPPPPGPTTDQKLLMEIRDLLARKV